MTYGKFFSGLALALVGCAPACVSIHTLNTIHPGPLWFGDTDEAAWLMFECACVGLGGMFTGLLTLIINAR